MFDIEDTVDVNIYRYNGSHGCVNCPDGPAWEMHNIVEAGYPVVIY